MLPSIAIVKEGPGPGFVEAEKTERSESSAWFGMRIGMRMRMRMRWFCVL